MKVLSRLLLGVGALLLWCVGLQQAFNLLNAPSDGDVVLGVISILGLLAVLALPIVYWAPTVLKHLRTYFAPMLLLLTLPFAAGCFKTVNPGYAGIKVNSWGTNRGVDAYPLQTGVVWYNPFNTKVITYPTFMQTVSWTANPHEGSSLNEEFSFNSKEGLRITADVSISYQLNPANVPTFYVKFRTDDIEDFTNGYLHNVVRNAFNDLAAEYSAEDLYGVKKSEFLERVRQSVNQQVDSIGVNVEQLGFIGLLRLPDNVVEALNAKVQAIQNAATAENKLKQVQAEADQRAAQAEGEAKANKELANSLSPALLEWRRLDLEQAAIARWKGEVPLYALPGSVPFIQLPAAGTR